MKICVYAISKNEEKFVDRWVDSMEEADGIYVLDTGSTDGTVEKLKKRGVHVTQKEIKPWRFDKARNASLELLPKDTDVCVCTDLDEVFEKGWRDKVEADFKEDITRLRYNYNWSFDTYGNPAVNFYIEKIHTYGDYIWTHPVHEILTYTKGTEVFKTDPTITVNHYPDLTKSRSSYLPLLELSVKEDPLDDRNMHYLGREYMYYEKWNDAIDTLIKHLSLPKATWKDERCASMRFIARCYVQLNRIFEAKMWYEKAIEEAPYLREPKVERGMLSYSLNEYKEAIAFLKDALEIPKNEKSYINEPVCYDGTVEDILSICLFYTKEKMEAYKYVKIAHAMKKEDTRIQNNLELIKESRYYSALKR